MHIAFRSNVTSVCAYVRTCLCHVSLGDHDLGIFYAKKLKFVMLLTHP